MDIKKKRIVAIITIFCFVGIIATSILMISWKQNINSNKKINQRIGKLIKTDKEDIIDIDFDELKNINSDTVGYIKVPNTNIDYVVVQGTDNSYYLNHNFNKEKNVAGWIFMDYKNIKDGTNKNTVIYGHDTEDGSMFGSLSNLLSEDLFTKNKNKLLIDYLNENNQKKYQVFSVYTIAPEEYYIKTNFQDNEFEKFKEEMKDRSIYKIDADLNNKNILTLSTCQNYGALRLVVHAVEI